jgi:hypothetical protein
MNNQQLFHIAGEVIVISGITIFLTNKIKKLENELKTVTQQLESRQQLYDEHLEHITGILNAIINDKEQKNETIDKKQENIEKYINTEDTKENNLSFFGVGGEIKNTIDNVLETVENIVNHSQEVINNIPSNISISLQLNDDQNILNINTDKGQDSTITNDNVQIQEVEEDDLVDEIQSLLTNDKETITQRETIIVPNNVEIPILSLEKVEIDQTELYSTEEPVEFVQIQKTENKKRNKKK